MDSLVLQSLQTNPDTKDSDYFARSTATHCGLRGLGMYEDGVNLLHPKIGPVTVLPSPFPKNSFEVCQALGPIFNTLYYRISMNTQWIEQKLNEAGCLSDPFIAGLCEISSAVYNPSFLESQISFTVFRHDFMMNAPDSTFNTKKLNLNLGDKKEYVPCKMVEANTTSCALLQLSQSISDIHRHTIKELIDLSMFPKIEDINSYLPKLDVINENADAFVKAVQLYKTLNQNDSTIGAENPKIFIALVLDSIETNGIDQLGVKLSIEQRGVPVHRISLESLCTDWESGKLRVSSRGCLLHNTPTGVLEYAMVYWRVFYHDRHITRPAMWDLRRLVEKSRAIKVPSIPMQLAGCKEIQRLVAERDVLESFLPPSFFHDDAVAQEKIVTAMMDSTCIQLDPCSSNAEDKKHVEDALKNPRDWVLKPQKEGGGNNVHGEDIPGVLKEILKGDTKSGYVLMSKIKAPTHKGVMLKLTETLCHCQHFPANSELGIFTAGLFYGDAKAPSDYAFPGVNYTLTVPGQILNCTTGYLCRTKFSDIPEGGVHAGFGFMDSIALIDDNCF